MAAPPLPEFMRQAISAALEGVRTGEGGPFGAAVVRGSQVLAVSCNRVISRNDPTAHAEIEAIRAACARLGTFELSGCEIYATCEPCPMCLAAAHWARVERVVFACGRKDAACAGFDDELLYTEISKPIGQRRLELVPFLREEALPLFRTWLDREDRVPY
ncbi:MAG: nucleoside deaminase [Planctomycetota bacterium]